MNKMAEEIFINKKEDIIIPFDYIGDELWQSNIERIITALDELWSNDKANPVPIEEIEALELRLGVSLPDTLKLFYQTFGIADIGEELQQFSDIDYIIKIWEPHPEYGPDFTAEDMVVLPSLITFSEYLGNGNMFCFHKDTKEIYYFDHDSQPYITKLFNSFDDYLKGCLVFAQADLFGDVEQDLVEQWAEEVVCDLVGEDIVRKWMY
jgi:hypothetical protein